MLFEEIIQKKAALAAEIDQEYQKPVNLYAELEEHLHKTMLENPHFTYWDKKAYAYPLIAEAIGIHAYKTVPFAFDFMSRGFRYDQEYTGISGWFRREQDSLAVTREFYADISGCGESGLSIYYRPVDDCHQSVDYERVLRLGFTGIIQQVKSQLENETDTNKISLYNGMICGLKAMIRLSERYCAEAYQSARQCDAGEDQKRLLSLAAALENAPKYPAVTFHQALNTIIFCYYAVPALEANNTSVLGHVDRLTYPYLKKDLENGTITQEEAYELIWRMLCICDARLPGHSGTNCTVTLGGCDACGSPVFNKVTELILKADTEFRIVDPKINIRVSKNSPEKLYRCIAQAQSKSVNNIAVFNDDVIIEANLRMGKALEDCRLYVGGGCQENVIAACEINSRATLYMNLTVPLMNGFMSGKWDFFLTANGERAVLFEDTDDFETVYRKTLQNIQSHIKAQIAMKRKYEARGVAYNASPLHSSLLGGCIESGKDMFAGGCKYSSASVSLTGIGTLIDSLLAIKKIVFEDQKYPLSRFGKIVSDNFTENEVLRQYIIHTAHKFSDEDAKTKQFCAGIFSDIAKVSKGYTDGRGGKYEASLFPFRAFEALGYGMTATPNGRKSGELLSPGMSPSIFARPAATQLIQSLSGIDMTDYAVVAVLDMKLPKVEASVLESLYKQFVENGGSVLQLNIINQNDLLEAQKHPEKYSDLIVRISGYSAYFTALSPRLQQEIIQRNCMEI